MTSRQRQFETVFRTLGSSARGSFYRAVPLTYQETPLSAIGSVRAGGRYNPINAFEVLYIGENPDTMVREIRMMVPDRLGRIVSAPKAPQISMTINWRFQRIADLTDSGIRKRLRVTLKELRQRGRAGMAPGGPAIGTRHRLHQQDILDILGVQIPVTDLLV